MSRKLIKIRIIDSHYVSVDKSKLPVVVPAWFDTWSGMYMVDTDFLPAIGMKGLPPGDWPFRPNEVEVLE